MDDYAKYYVVQVDGRFPDYRTKEVAMYLTDPNYVLVDKTMVKDRYVTYIFARKDADVGTCKP